MDIIILGMLTQTLFKIITIIRKYHQIQAAKIMNTMETTKIKIKTQNLKIQIQIRSIRQNIIPATAKNMVQEKTPWRKWTNKPEH